MTHEEAARRLGMKTSEIVEVLATLAGDAVQTHDGQWTLIRPDGTLGLGLGAPEVVEEIPESAAAAIAKHSAEWVGEHGPELPAPKPAKKAAKR